eukprot:1158259-Pelagomonas_calceolata.AAC.3
MDTSIQPRLQTTGNHVPILQAHLQVQVKKQLCDTVGVFGHSVGLGFQQSFRNKSQNPLLLCCQQQLMHLSQAFRHGRMQLLNWGQGSRKRSRVRAGRVKAVCRIERPLLWTPCRPPAQMHQ